MKKCFLLVAALILAGGLFAQNNLGKADDIARISLTTVLPQQIANMPKAAEGLLKNKISEVATKNGMGGTGNPQFILTANVVEITKDITATAPPMHTYTLQVTFYIADYINKTSFASVSKQVKGAGQTPDKAYIAALKTINPGDPEIKNFVETGKTKIVEYFNSKCDFIIKEAQTKAATKDFQAAIYKLTSVPDVCKECYNKAMAAVPPIYKQFMDDMCNKNLAKAKAAWAAAMNSNGASEAQGYLGSITPDASCYADAENLVKEIKAKLFADEKREWAFMVKQWDDQVSLESQRISAYRDVGVAFGQNQPQTVYDVTFLW